MIIIIIIAENTTQFVLCSYDSFYKLRVTFSNCMLWAYRLYYHISVHEILWIMYIDECRLQQNNVQIFT
jgi:hypothetical protein